MRESNARPGWAKGVFVLVTLVVSSVYAIVGVGYVSVKYRKGWVRRMVMKRTASAT